MVDRKERRDGPACRSINKLVACYLQNKLQDRYWKNKTLSDANRILCVTMTGVTGALIASVVAGAGASYYVSIFITSALITSAAAAGYICSYFTEGLIFEALTGKSRQDLYEMLWLRDELTKIIRRVNELPCISDEDKQVMIKEAYAVFTKNAQRRLQ